jgi:CMP-N-acetylneuraminic acid synthetase
MGKDVIAIIPARGGSKGVPKKNIRILRGFPLIAYSIMAGTLANRVQRVIVSTDSPEIADIATLFGAEVPFLRPVHLARDDSSDREFFIHALNWFKDNTGAVPECLVHLRPTTPLRDPAVIDLAVEAVISRPQATSLRSGHQAPETPFKWFFINRDGYLEGLLPNDPRPEYYNLPRQAFQPVYIPNGYVDIVKSQHVLTSESLHGPRMIGFVTDVVREVDTIEDFDFLNFEIETKGHLLWDLLRSRFPNLQAGL